MPRLGRLVFDLVRAERAGLPGLAARQRRRLGALVAHARAHSPFYRRAYGALPAQGVELAQLPPVSKPQLMAAFDDWLAVEPRITRAEVEAFVADPARVGTLFRERFFVCTTSGTTGHPAMLVHDARALAVYRAIVLGRLDRMWLGAAELLAMLRRGFRWAGVLGTGGHFGAAGYMELDRARSDRRARSTRVFSAQLPVAELVAALDAFDPTVLSAYPSVLDVLAREQAAGRLHLRPILVESGAESADAEAKARIAAAFGVPVRDLYGASEFLFAACSCDHDWLHVSSDWVVLEPVDEQARPTPPGEPSHTVLLTNLANRAQPIIRYDLGDSVMSRPDPCPCGSVLPAIRVAGRRDDVLHLESADGRRVAIVPIAVSVVTDTTPGVARCQLVQTGRSTLQVRLDVTPGFEAERVWRDVTANLGRFLAGQGLANVELVRTREPPARSPRSGKFRHVIAAGGG